MDEAYKEFVMQLASWDTRREFWLQTDYYKQRMVGNSKADAALLDEMINNIQFIPGDFTRAVNDSVKLMPKPRLTLITCYVSMLLCQPACSQPSE